MCAGSWNPAYGDRNPICIACIVHILESPISVAEALPDSVARYMIFPFRPPSSFVDSPFHLFADKGPGLEKLLWVVVRSPRPHWLYACVDLVDGKRIRAWNPAPPESAQLGISLEYSCLGS